MKLSGGGCVIVCFGLFWCGLTFLADGAMLYKLACQLSASAFYVAGEGTILHAEVNADSSGEGTSYTPAAEYRYSVREREYQGKVIRHDYVGFGRRPAEQVVERYAVGQQVPVFYNPQAPEHAVLERGPHIGNGMILLFMAPFNAVAFGFLIGAGASVRSRHLGRPILGINVREEFNQTVIRVYDFSPLIIALAAWGGAGFIATFAALLLSWLFDSLVVALAILWPIVLAIILSAWIWARRRVGEIRIDSLRGEVTLRVRGGEEEIIPAENVRRVTYTKSIRKDSDGDAVERYVLSLPYRATTDENRSFPLPEQSSAEDAAAFAEWLNGLLEVRRASSEQA